MTGPTCTEKEQPEQWTSSHFLLIYVLCGPYLFSVSFCMPLISTASSFTNGIRHSRCQTPAEYALYAKGFQELVRVASPCPSNCRRKCRVLDGRSVSPRVVDRPQSGAKGIAAKSRVNRSRMRDIAASRSVRFEGRP